MKRVLDIAGLTIQEAVRKKIIIAGLALTVVFLIIYGSGVYYAVDSIRDSAGRGHAPGGVGGAKDFIQFEAALFLFLGLFVANLVSALVAVFSAAGTIGGEIEQGFMQAVAVRPIGRRRLLLGKWLGHAVMVASYMGALFAALVLIIYSQSGWLPANVWPAGFALIGEVLLILSAAVFGSTFLNTATNAVVVLMLFMTSLIGGTMEQIGVAIGKEGLFTTGIVSGLIMPTDALYRYALTLMQPETPKALGMSAAANLGPFGAASPPSIYMLLYAVVFGTALLAGALAVFARRDILKRGRKPRLLRSTPQSKVRFAGAPGYPPPRLGYVIAHTRPHLGASTPQDPVRLARTPVRLPCIRDFRPRSPILTGLPAFRPDL